MSMSISAFQFQTGDGLGDTSSLFEAEVYGGPEVDAPIEAGDSSFLGTLTE